MRNCSIAFSPILLVLTIYPCAAAASWTNISSGLTGQHEGVQVLTIDSAGSTLYAIGSQAFKSTDGGSNWRMLGGLTGAKVLVVDPVSTSKIYAGTGHGIWESTDGGETWALAGLPGISITTLVIDPLTPSTLYAGGLSDQAYRSTDGGATWTGFSVGFPDSSHSAVVSMLIHPSTPATLYLIGAGSGSPLYKSTDGAQSWSVIASGPFFRLLAITPSSLYAILGGVGFSTSTDGGATWTSTGFAKDVLSIVFDPATPGTVYGSISAPVGSPPGFYKSQDGGHNWIAVNLKMPFAGPLALDPAAPSVIYGASTTGGVFKSSDAGETWRVINTGLSAANVQVLLGDPLTPSTIYAGGAGGLFKSTDPAASWNLQAAFQAAGVAPPGLPPPAVPIPSPAAASVRSMLIDFTNPNVLYVSTARIDGCFFSDVLLYKSLDGGLTWSDSVNPSQSGCSDDTLLAMDPTDPNTLYIRSGDYFDGYGLRKTSDGGATWTYTGLSANVLYTVAINPAHPSTLYAGTDNGVVRSTDGGATWNAFALANTNVTLLAIDPAQPNTLYAATTAAYLATPGFVGIFKSTDEGTHWTSISRGLEDVLASRLPVNGLIVDFEQTSVLYLATGGYGVFRSVDGGVRWAPFSDGLTNLDVRVLMTTRAPAKAVYGGTPEGIFRIADDPLEPQTIPRHPVR